MTLDRPKLLITGATHQVGTFLRLRAEAAGLLLVLVSRNPPEENRAGVQWQAIDISLSCALPAAQTLIHLAPLPLLPPLLPGFFASGGRRVLAFSTTSRSSKAASRYLSEQAFAAQVLAAEEEVARICEKHGGHWTLFRPTLIYGAHRDRNVELISRFVRRFGFFPLLGEAGGLRQPVHADDLAAAFLAALDQPASFNKAYDLPGGEIVSYREMVSRIFVAQGLRPRFLHLPVGLFAVLMQLAALVPRYRDFNPEMARRMNLDLVFDSTAARQDFGYSPRGFMPPGPEEAA